MSAPSAASGTAAAKRPSRASLASAAGARPMASSTASEPCWSERWKWGQIRGAAARRSIELRRHEPRVERAQPDPGAVRRAPRSAARRSASADPRLEIPPVGAQSGFPTGRSRGSRGRPRPATASDDASGGQAPAPPADRGDDAEGAGPVAAVLDLEKGPGPEAGRAAPPAPRVRPAPTRRGVRQPVLAAVGHDLPDAGQAGQLAGRPLGQAAGDDDAGGGILAGRAADELRTSRSARAVRVQVLTTTISLRPRLRRPGAGPGPGSRRPRRRPRPG